MNEILIYVHGIGQHDAGFSNDWFEAMSPHLSKDLQREEVIWSQIVNPAIMATAMAAMSDTNEFVMLKNSIDNVMHDRMLQQELEEEGPTRLMNETPADLAAFSSIDDFVLYMVNSFVRKQILDRFEMILQPHLESGKTIHVIAHSWGSVVSYEGMRRLESIMPTGTINNFFSVGSALSIAPVQSNLFQRLPGGRRPNMVERWINMDARGDLVGGRLSNVFDVDLPEHLRLDPVECGSFFGLVIPSCAHSSYFVEANKETNKEIFAEFING